MCDPVHDVETIHGLCLLLTASGNMDDTRKTTVSEGEIQYPHGTLRHT